MKKHLIFHDPSWKISYQIEATAIQRAFGKNIAYIHHIGSTSIPGIIAKPIIDILVEVIELSIVDTQEINMAKIGYEAKGAYGIEGRRYFRKHDKKGTRTHHLHVFARNNPHVLKHIAFRDYLIAHPKIAKEYSELKEKLAENSQTYQGAKEPFITATLKDALVWKARSKEDT